MAYKKTKTPTGETANINSKKISINRRKFQGDSINGLLFCLCLDPLSLILRRKAKGFKIKTNRRECALTHYSTSVKFDIKKNVKFESGTPMRDPVYKITNAEKIPSTQHAEYYKYLGYEQNKPTDGTVPYTN